MTWNYRAPKTYFRGHLQRCPNNEKTAVLRVLSYFIRVPYKIVKIANARSENSFSPGPWLFDLVLQFTQDQMTKSLSPGP